MSTDEAVVIINIGAACKGNPGPGGWGAVISRKGRDSKEISGGEFYATSHEMELAAVINALGALKKPLPVRLQTNAAYIVDGMTKWLPGWKAKGWRKSDGKPVPNAELWQRVEALAAPHQIEWAHVRSHVGEAGNERAYTLANLHVGRSSHLPSRTTPL